MKEKRTDFARLADDEYMAAASRVNGGQARGAKFD